MAVPTLAEIRAIVIAWWREPGRPKLDDLKARIAAAWTDPRAALSIRIVDIPIQGLAIVAELRIHDVNGNTVQTVTRQWQPAGERPGADLDDVIDDSIDARTPRERREAAVIAAALRLR